MKQLLFTFATLFCLQTLQAQEVPQTQRVLISKVAATWCPHCGGWGWTFLDDLIEDNADKATILTLHHSGNLVTPTSSALATNLNFQGQPQFFLNNNNEGVNSGNAASKRTVFKTAVDNSLTTSPTVNTGLEATHDGTTITVNTKTKFFQALSGDYKLGLYIVNEGYEGTQAGQSGSVLHKKVLAKSFTDEHFGNIVGSGDIATNTEVDGTYSIAIDPSWDVSKLEIAAIIWSEMEGSHIYINSNTTTDIALETTTSVSDLSDKITSRMIPNIVSSEAELNLGLKETIENVSIQLVNQGGQVVQQIFTGKLNQGEHNFTILRKNLSSGLYFVTVNTENGKLVKKVIVK